RRPTKRSRSSQPGASAARPAAKAPQVNGAFHPTNDAILVPKTSFETRSTVGSLRESMWTGALVRHSSIPVLFAGTGPPIRPADAVRWVTTRPSWSEAGVGRQPPLLPLALAVSSLAVWGRGLVAVVAALPACAGSECLHDPCG